jgi:4-carboxymuconolactone decarboxylase
LVAGAGNFYGVLSRSRLFRRCISQEGTMNEPRMLQGRKNLAAIEGSDRASITETLKDIAPDLADLAIGFAYGDLYSRAGLSLQERQLATVAALATMGGVEPQLEFHIAGALNVGCSPTEIVELMTHLTVYAGFPVALNGTAAAKRVFERRGVRPPIAAADAAPAASRYDKGWACLREVDGHLGERVIDSLSDIAPDLGRFIIEFAFGDVYTRPGMDLRLRELVTVAALTAIGSATPQLKVHMNGFLNVGGTPAQLVEIVTHLAAYAGFPRAIGGAMLAKKVLADRAR